MRQKKKIRKKKTKITPASLVGMLLGLLLIGAGLHICIFSDEHAGYPTIGLGVFLMILIIIISRGKRAK